MEFLGSFHPQIVHFPIALLLLSPLFEIVGRATDVQWWRRAALAMLVIGVVGAFFAVQSGEPASEKAEHAGVAESAVEAHEDIAKVAMWIGLGALAARIGAEVLKGGAAGAVGGLALLLQIAAAVTVGIAGYRGGKLVYEHGANVTVNGQPVTQGGAGGAETAEQANGGRGGEHDEEGEHR